MKATDRCQIKELKSKMAGWYCETLSFHGWHRYMAAISQQCYVNMNFCLNSLCVSYSECLNFHTATVYHFLIPWGVRFGTLLSIDQKVKQKYFSEIV